MYFRSSTSYSPLNVITQISTSSASSSKYELPKNLKCTEAEIGCCLQKDLEIRG